MNKQTFVNTVDSCMTTLGVKFGKNSNEAASLLCDALRPMLNDNLVIGDVIAMAAKEMTTNPQRLLGACVVVDGVAEITDEQLAAVKEALPTLVADLKNSPSERQATVAAISIWSQEAQLKHAA